MTGVNVLFSNWYLLGVKYISSHAHKTGSCYLLGRGFVSIFATSYPRRFVLCGTQPQDLHPTLFKMLVIFRHYLNHHETLLHRRFVIGTIGIQYCRKANKY